MININQELINMVMNLPNLNISIIDAHQMGNIINKLLNRDYTDNDGEKEPDLFIEGNVYDVYGIYQYGKTTTTTTTSKGS